MAITGMDPGGTERHIENNHQSIAAMALPEADVIPTADGGKVANAEPEPHVLFVQEFDALIRRDFERYGGVVNAIGLNIE
jgi:hypothetical protein